MLQLLHINRERRMNIVQEFAALDSVTLSNFVIDWNEFSGSFHVSLDNTEIADKFNFFLEGTGKTTFSPPMFHSPFTYPAVKLSEATSKGIVEALHHTIPKIKGAGIDISFHTPPKFRISPEALKEAKEKVTEDYSISVLV